MSTTERPGLIQLTPAGCPRRAAYWSVALLVGLFLNALAGWWADPPPRS